MDGKIKILFVGDEKQHRESYEMLLNSSGYEVITAEDGQIALDILAGKQIDITLLDLNMSMEDQKVFEPLFTTHPPMPVIILTDNETTDNALESIKKGAYDFISKPFKTDQFLHTVKRAADKSNAGKKERQAQEEIIQTLFDLNTEKKRLKTIINCMANGVMVTNSNLETTLHNPALIRLMGISEEIKNPAPVTTIINDKSIISTLKKIQRGECPIDEFTSQEVNIGTRTLRAISAPALAPDRNVFWKVVGAVTVFEDISAFKQLDRMKTDFVNMVAHELRSPLVSIRQLNSVLSEGLAGELQEKQKEFVKRGIKKIDALLALINDLLDVAKIEAGKYVRQKVPTDIGKIIEETVSIMAPRADEQGITLSFSCQDLKPVEADPKNMEEIFNNLISNAINYSTGGGSVTVSAKGMGDYLEIKVEDTGVGISSEELPKIFDKFYRVKHPKTRQVTGTGLGLAIVKGVVEAHHGTIHVESIMDKGTVFRIRIPVMTESKSSIPPF
jgi:two-component system, OmpR family, phosphate regulon sensor histidine kinase PhoR